MKIFKKTRKGFTLVELLIVIIILGALAATMMLNSGESVAAAKANTIVANLSTIKYAALQYYADNVNNGATIKGFCDSADAYLGELAKTGESNNEGLIVQNGIKYGIRSDNDNKHWFARCQFKDDADAATISKKLIGLASTAQLVNNRNGDEAKKAYDGTFEKDKYYVYMRIR